MGTGGGADFWGRVPSLALDPSNQRYLWGGPGRGSGGSRPDAPGHRRASPLKRRNPKSNPYSSSQQARKKEPERGRLTAGRKEKQLTLLRQVKGPAYSRYIQFPGPSDPKNTNQKPEGLEGRSCPQGPGGAPLR